MNKKEEVKNEKINVKLTEPKWSIEFAPNTFIYTPDKFNWFNRLMQRLILGIKWKRI